jgi:prevent-host-death family protein
MMSDTMVGIREIRRNLSVYLARVKRGERFIVTERGKPVASLQPYSEADDPLAKIRARGLIIREPSGEGVEGLPVFDFALSRPSEEIISEMREDKI